jgi:hypothetical protein
MDRLQLLLAAGWSPSSLEAAVTDTDSSPTSATRETRETRDADNKEPTTATLVTAASTGPTVGADKEKLIILSHNDSSNTSCTAHGYIPATNTLSAPANRSMASTMRNKSFSFTSPPGKLSSSLCYPPKQLPLQSRPIACARPSGLSASPVHLNLIDLCKTSPLIDSLSTPTLTQYRDLKTTPSPSRFIDLTIGDFESKVASVVEAPKKSVFQSAREILKTSDLSRSSFDISTKQCSQVPSCSTSSSVDASSYPLHTLDDELSNGWRLFDHQKEAIVQALVNRRSILGTHSLHHVSLIAY